MSKQLKTINVSGGQYAKVSDRLRVFREDNPNGVIKTSYIKTDSAVVFTAEVFKNTSEESGSATGHSLGSLGKAKSFEKLETTAVGRALALLGYLADGEIASFEEMQEYNRDSDKQEILDEYNQDNG